MVFICLKYHSTTFQHCQRITLARSYGSALKRTHPCCWHHRLWLNIWIRHGDPITPSGAAIGPRSAVYGPDSGLRQLHSPSPKATSMMPSCLRTVYAASNQRPIRFWKTALLANHKAKRWRRGGERGVALIPRVSPWWLHSKATAVGRSSVCLSSSKLNKRTRWRVSVRYQLSNEIRPVRHRWDEAEYLSFESDRWCSLKKERVGRRSHFVPTVWEKERQRH